MEVVSSRFYRCCIIIICEGYIFSILGVCGNMYISVKDINDIVSTSNGIVPKVAAVFTGLTTAAPFPLDVGRPVHMFPILYCSLTYV